MRSEEWPEVRLGDVVDLLTGFPFKSVEFTDDPQDVPLVRGDNVVQGRFRWDAVRRWPRTDIDAYSGYLLKSGDVILAMDRPWIEAGLKYATACPGDLPCLLVQRVSRLRGANGLSTRFLRYVIGSPAFTEYVLAVQTGTAVPHISSRQIADYRFALPPVVEQERISEILGALDDKIGLNRCTHRTLGSIARAFFKSWFVDFDPVRKKMEGREVGLPSDLAAMFPSSLGEIPAGWAVEAVGELIALRYGKALRAQDRQPGSVPVYGSNGQVGWHDTLLVPGPGIVVGRKGSPGTVSWVQGDFFPIDTTFYVRPKRDEADLHYLYHALDGLDLPNLSADSAVPGLNRESAYHARLLRPPLALTTAFGSFVKPLAEKQAQSQHELVRLAETRNALLPSLLDGTLHHAHQCRGVRCD